MNLSENGAIVYNGSKSSDVLFGYINNQGNLLGWNLHWQQPTWSGCKEQVMNALVNYNKGQMHRMIGPSTAVLPEDPFLLAIHLPYKASTKREKLQSFLQSWDEKLQHEELTIVEPVENNPKAVVLKVPIEWLASPQRYSFFLELVRLGVKVTNEENPLQLYDKITSRKKTYFKGGAYGLRKPSSRDRFEWVWENGSLALFTDEWNGGVYNRGWIDGVAEI